VSLKENGQSLGIVRKMMDRVMETKIEILCASYETTKGQQHRIVGTTLWFPNE